MKLIIFITPVQAHDKYTGSCGDRVVASSRKHSHQGWEVTGTQEHHTHFTSRGFTG